jgi:ABC-type Na+ transport system ATPase subunit NatA
MSEEKTLQTLDTYDFNDTIKGIELSTAYIPGLQRILTDKLLNFSEGTAKLPDMFKKFEQNIDKTEEEEKVNLGLNLEESDIYTLFSLTQLLKYLANEQGLAKKTETTATVEELKELMTMMEKQEDITEKLKDLQDKIKIVN